MRFVLRSEPIQKAKKVVRREVSQALHLMGDDDRERQSIFIYSKLFALPEFKRADRMACHISGPQELDTSPIFYHSFKNNKTCFIPRFDYKQKSIDMVKLRDMIDLEQIKAEGRQFYLKNTNVRDEALQTGGLDFIIVNGLAFTPTGLRIGQGGGYYDNYLRRIFATSKRRPMAVALAFKQQIYSSLPAHFYDVPVDRVLSGSRGE